MSKQIICGIYKITSPTGRIYIGKSKDCVTRQLNYRHNQIKSQAKIYSSIKKHGWSSHSFEIIHECNPEELDLWEMHFIDFYKSHGTRIGMNLTIGGGGTNGSRHSAAARKKISIGNKGKIVPVETREQIRKTLTGVKHTEERRINIKTALTGRTATDEHRRNISIALTGMKFKKWSAESVANRIANHPNRRAVLNTQTGIFYLDCKEAADSIGWNFKTLRNHLLGYNKNRTDFIYV